MKKLLLCTPNQRWFKPSSNWGRLPPTTACQLAAMVEDIVEVALIDAQFDDMTVEAFKEAVLQQRPDFVGISSHTSEYAPILDVAVDAVKAVLPDAPVIAGGVHVTTNPRLVMDNPNIDYACRGEGEYLLREWLLYMLGRGGLPEKGLVHRENGEVVVQDLVLVEDLTVLPWPDYGLVDLDRYIQADRPSGSNRYPEFPGTVMVVTRGCPFRCSFCQVEDISGLKIRARDPDAVVEHLEGLKRRHGIRSLTFSDDNLFSNKKVAKKLFRVMIERDLGLKWHADAVALFSLDDEMMDLMRDSGCVGINIAVESGSQRVLTDLIGKPIKNLKIVPDIIRRVRRRGMFVLANFMIGFPGESWEEIRETVRFAEHCGADYVKFFITTIFRQTRLYELAIAEDALLVPDKDLGLTREFSQVRSDEWTPEELAIIRVYEWDRINFTPQRIGRLAEIWGCSVDELQALRRDTRDRLLATAASWGNTEAGMPSP